ncbi:MAG: metalloregulator ArsR/SmtB family transcription factor [Candidatus Eisenbacteria bacterium]
MSMSARSEVVAKEILMVDKKLIETLIDDLEMADIRCQVLRALGNPIRLRIMASLCVSGESSVGEIRETLGLAQATISQQLASLRLHGLVKARKDGGFRRYSVALPPIADLMTCLARCHRDHAEERHAPGD